MKEIVLQCSINLARSYNQVRKKSINTKVESLLNVIEY